MGGAFDVRAGGWPGSCVGGAAGEYAGKASVVGKLKGSATVGMAPGRELLSEVGYAAEGIELEECDAGTQLPEGARAPLASVTGGPW